MTTRPVLSTVVLDLGQVLVEWEPWRAHPELTRQAWDAVARQIGFDELNLRADAGERWADLEAEVAARWSELAGFVERYEREFAATLVGPVAGMPALVGQLRERGLRLLGLTNWSTETFPRGVAAVPAIGELEAVVVSGEIGLVKPDPAIFEHLLATHDVDPATALFVDDRADNVEAAVAVGFHGHVFTTAAALRRELAVLGVTLDDVPEQAPPSGSGAPA